MFTAEELELMISGMPEIDINDLRDNTVYVNYSKESKIIIDFWDILKELDKNHKA